MYHRGSQRAAVKWRLHKLVMAVNRAYLMSESTADSKCSNNSPEIPLRLKRSRSNDKETSIKVLPSVLGPSFPWNSERLFDRFESRNWLIYADVTLLPRAGNPCEMYSQGSTGSRFFQGYQYFLRYCKWRRWKIIDSGVEKGRGEWARKL